ncbi:electron transport complex, RnfABCDGE type, D subunit [Candidatus Photodesmus katoptron Akat1]|uniref:Ion-translocating oxidoreductase complex subunit D n=2 Tax=Candidatus Photodesmus anomalopis TaxID=28176 RepID=S3EHJ1_9GAMM|nr:electron transport complex, RnfABCDGE type, D subunit [Candidatus Photodesmus katoptron Akat1]
MQLVIICLFPGLVAQTYFFGWGTIIQLCFSIIISILLEIFVILLRKRHPKTALRDNSVLVTAWILAISIPPLSPWWIVFIGLIFAVVIAKHLYGGIGENLFNPAMIAYVILLVSFPIQMTSWIEAGKLKIDPISFIDSFFLIFSGFNTDGLSLQQLRVGVDGLTMATPLDAFRTSLHIGNTINEILEQLKLDPLFTSSWKLINLTYLLSGLLLLKLRVISWHIPISFLISLIIISELFMIITPDKTASSMFHLLSGATMLGAFFIATDPVSASTTVKGRIIFGAFIGIMTFIIRSFGGFPDSIAFSVLLANMCVPLLDHYTQPRTYGQ